MNTATISFNGKTYDFILNEKQFSTGSTGFFGNGKIEIGDKKYQTQIQLVLVGSNPNKKKAK
jgi:hypothetical protein